MLLCAYNIFFFGAEILHSLLRVYELRLMHALKGKKDGVSFFYYFSYSFTRLDEDVDGTFFCALCEDQLLRVTFLYDRGLLREKKKRNI
jgi:hypothetical protein